MILKFIMRDAAGEVVAGTPTVTADGDALAPTDETDYWTIDAPLGSLVTATLAGAVPLDVQMPLVDGTTLAATGDAMTLTGAYDNAKDDVLTPLAEKASQASVDAIPTTPLLADDYIAPDNATVAAIAADYAKTGEAAAAAAGLATEANATANKAAVLAAVAAGEPADLGTDTCTLTIKDADGDVVTDARVYVSSDEAGTIRSATKVTNALGQVAFDLTDGDTFYVWRYSSTVDFTAVNPQAFVAVED